MVGPRRAAGNAAARCALRSGRRTPRQTWPRPGRCTSTSTSAGSSAIASTWAAICRGTRWATSTDCRRCRQNGRAPARRFKFSVEMDLRPAASATRPAGPKKGRPAKARGPAAPW